MYIWRPDELNVCLSCCRLKHLQSNLRGGSDKPIFGPKVDGILQVGCKAKRRMRLHM